MEIRDLSPHVGVEVSGIDLNGPVPEEAARELRRLFNTRHLLLIHQPDLSGEAQIRLGNLFGHVILRAAKNDNDPAEAITQYVSNNRDDGILGQGELKYHHDHLHFASPLRAIGLFGQQIPSSGSATKFRSAVRVTQCLPSSLYERAAKIECLHIYNYDDFPMGTPPDEVPEDKHPRAWQPLLWRNPDTGIENLWIGGRYLAGFRGVPAEEGWSVTMALRDHANSVEDALYRHEWRVGDMVIWNNRVLEHAREPFNADEPRTLRRITVA